MQDKIRSFFYGGGLVLVGLWLLLGALGVRLPGWPVVWPVLLILGALSSFYHGIRNTPRDPGGVWFGVTGALSGILFLYIGAGYGRWEDLATLWPWFPAAAGAGWLAAWLVRPRDLANLILGLAALLAGGLGFLYTFGMMNPAIGAWLLRWWPLMLIGVGGAYIAQYFLQRQQDVDRD